MNRNFRILISLVMSLWLGTAPLQAQLILRAAAAEGSGYPLVLAAGLDIETPDCEHTDFGPHVTQVYDADLDRHVFAFHSHIVADNDRCLVFDRVRMEIKGGPGTDAEAQHLEGDTSYYRWKFRLAEDFVGASSFCHLFQNKVRGGDDDSFPVVTFTAGTDRLELRHNGGASGTSLGSLAEVALADIRGRWLEAYVHQVHQDDGLLEVTLRDMATGRTFLEYFNDEIDLWRPGVEYSRPKWGVYRAKNDVLRDEIVRFADFCISETRADRCPAEAVVIPDTTPPSAPANLRATSIEINSVDLSWDAASDDFGVTAYDLLQGGQPVATVATTETTVNDLTGSTTYTFAVRAKDEAGNISENSIALTLTTDPPDALPEAANTPFPADGATEVSTQAVLSWAAGENTERFALYLGTEAPPPFLQEQVSTNYVPTLLATTTYYWQVGAINDNGISPGPVWSFTTGAAPAESSWIVYRANARLHEELSRWELESAPANPLVDELSADPIVETNSFYSYRYDGEEKFRWRTALNETDSAITIVARLMPQSPQVNGMCHFEVRAGGWRQKVRLNDGNIKLEATTPVIERDLPFDWDDQMHVFRMVVDGPQTTIYLDEDPEPFLTGSSDETTSLSYFDWGKGGASDYGARIDWLAFDPTGAYVPDAGEALPADLIRSNDACLSELRINGFLVDGFSPLTLEYNVDVATSLPPNISWTTRSRFATSELNNPSNPEGTQGTVVVTADDGVSTKTYTLNYLVVNLEEEEQATDLVLFPNPATDYVQVSIPPGEQASATILSWDGQVLKTGLLLTDQAQWDISDLSAGTYLLRVERASHHFQYYKLIVQ